MATAGIFMLVVDDGRQDHLLMASRDLRDRLIALEKIRASDPSTANDPSPKISDIEDTHVLFMSAHFKPFCAIGYEYNIVTPQSSISALQATSITPQVTFSIPQFGDFFHDMIFHIVLTQPTLSTSSSADSDKPLMRWCNYPGERLIAQASFAVNGNPLDSYNQYDANFYREFCVPPNKRLAYDRCMGQEEAQKGYITQPNWALSGVAPADILSRVRTDVYTGNQTPTGAAGKTDLELFIPLQFWFNKDSRLAIPSVAIPYGQRFVNLNLCSSGELCNVYPRGSTTWASTSDTIGTVGVSTLELYVNNIFVNNEIHDIYIKQVGFNLIRVHKQHANQATASTGDELLHQLKWPIEHMFVGMKVNDYVLSDTTHTKQYMDRWNSFCQITPTSYSIGGWNQLQKTTLSGTSAYDASATTLTGAAGSHYDTELAVGDFVKIGTGALVQVASITSASAASASGGAIAIGAAAACAYRVTNPTVLSEVSVPTMDTITLKSHGTLIYNNIPTGFFNSYIPYHYGGVNITSPTDIGALMITFNLYPGTYQPSGHLNLSRARETYLCYTSSVITNTNTGQLIISASAINFLLISDGSAVLRYST